MTAVASVSNTHPVVRWVWLYAVKPVAQIVLFVAGAALIMSAIAMAFALIFNTNWHGIDVLRVNPRFNLPQLLATQLPNTLIDGITQGFVYAMIALGYTMVYGVLKFINFAHSEIFMVGAVVGFEVLQNLVQRQTLGVWNPVMLVIFMIVCAMLFCGTLAVVVERIAYKPLRGAPKLVPLISAIGVSFIITDVVRAYADIARGISRMPYPKVDFFALNVPIPGNAQINYASIMIIVFAILMVIGLNYFVNATKLGKAIRAVSQDQTTAALMGINVNVMITLTFFIGGALGGAGGVLFSLKSGVADPYMGFIPGLKAFTAAVLGGIGNIQGALLGGLLLGLIEAFFSSLLPYFPALGTAYRDIFAFSILILVLLFRPSGLLGKKVDEKV
jgi:branched-chain amino acid transport system permease protein